MEIFVKGVKIKLTDEQMKLIKDSIADREKSCSTFYAVFKEFRFQKLNTKDWEDPSQICYFQKKYGWVATMVIDPSFISCVVNGHILDRGNPWGKVYESPMELVEAIANAIDELQNEI